MENNTPLFLKKTSEFLFIKENGKRHWVNKWLLFSYLKSGPCLRFGVTASRKVGPAVTRNKLKRWSKEYFRGFAKSGNTLEADVNIIFKPIDHSFYKGLSYDEFKKAMDRGVEALRKQL